MKVAAIFMLCLICLPARAEPARANAKLDTAKIEELTGAKGKLDEKEGVFKVSVPRSDSAVIAGGRADHAADGADLLGGVHAGGHAHDGDGRHRAARGPGEPGDERRARQRPRGHRAAQPLLLGHAEGDVHAHRRHGRRGEARDRASARCSPKIKETSGGKGEVPQADIDPGEEHARSRRRSTRSSAHEGELKDGVYKVTIGRTTKMGGHAVGNAMGVNTWAAFAGSDDKAVVDGDFAMLESELQGVLKALRAAGINISSPSTST